MFSNEVQIMSGQHPPLFKPKKGDVRILTAFRRLNAQTKRKQFPLTKISDLLRKLSGSKYATANEHHLDRL
jgi:hypothetical protein